MLWLPRYAVLDRVISFPKFSRIGVEVMPASVRYLMLLYFYSLLSSGIRGLLRAESPLTYCAVVFTGLLSSRLTWSYWFQIRLLTLIVDRDFLVSGNPPGKLRQSSRVICSYRLLHASITGTRSARPDTHRKG